MHTANRAILFQNGSDRLARHQGSASRDSFFQHHLVKIASPDLPRVPREELPVGITSGHRDEPAAGLTLAIDFDALLARVLSAVHLLLQSQLPQNLAAPAGQ